MWLVSCMRQGMLTQGPAPDPKCKLIISSFLTLPHLLDCFICTRNAMSIVLLLQITGGMGEVGGGSFILGCGWGYRGWVSSYSFCFFLMLLHLVVSRSQSLYLAGWNMIAVVSVSLLFLYFLCLWSL